MNPAEYAAKVAAALRRTFAALPPPPVKNNG